MNILEVSGLTVRYGSGANAITAAEDIDLAVPKGGSLGLVGESGCGKSTIARALVGLVPVVGGSIRLAGVDFSSNAVRNAAAYRRRVQMVFQDPFSSLNPRMSVGEMMSEATRMRGHAFASARARRAESRRVLDLVGMPTDSLDRYPHQFSGGQRQRLAIARALAVGPELLINDEITSALDVSVQGTILNLMMDLQRELGLSYIFISHDLSVIRAVSDVVAVMYLGRVVEYGDADQLFRTPAHPYTGGLVDSVPTLEGARKPAPVVGDPPDPRNPPIGCRFHTRCPIGPLARPKRTICLEQDPQQVAINSPHRSACHFADEYNRQAIGGDPVVAPVPPMRARR